MSFCRHKTTIYFQKTIAFIKGEINESSYRAGLLFSDSIGTLKTTACVTFQKGCSHALRGNAAYDALRPWDAERPYMNYHGGSGHLILACGENWTTKLCKTRTEKPNDKLKPATIMY